MPKWISVEKAVIKYHIEKEAILLWVEMGQFPMLYIDNVPNVDEECILELFRRSKAGITAEYIDTLEQLCIDKNNGLREIRPHYSIERRGNSAAEGNKYVDKRNTGSNEETK